MHTLVTIVTVMNLSVCGGVKTGRLLGLDGSIGDGLIEIDIDTGESTFLFPFGVNPSAGALAVAPDGTLYAAFVGDVDRLFIVDPDAEEVTPVGFFGFEDVSGLAFAPDGTLYGVDRTSDQLITIDPLTGEGTAVGIVVRSGNGLTFTPDGTLYLIGNPVGGARLYTVDPDTAEATEVGLFGSDLIGASGLAAIGDVLYADAYQPIWPFEGMVTLDRETGEATVVGDYCPHKDCHSANGLAFLPGPGDADRDGDVDHDDFDIFVSCFTGPDPGDELPVGCLFLDTDDDGDIDCDDWIEFIAAWTEEEDPPSFPKCEPCAGDVNGDDMVDPLDSGFVLARFGCPVGEGDPDCDIADQNGDNAVDPLDIGFVLARFGPCD